MVCDNSLCASHDSHRRISGERDSVNGCSHSKASNAEIVNSYAAFGIGDTPIALLYHIDILN